MISRWTIEEILSVIRIEIKKAQWTVWSHSPQWTNPWRYLKGKEKKRQEKKEEKDMEKKEEMKGEKWKERNEKK